MHLDHMQQILRRIMRGEVTERQPQAVEFVRAVEPGSTKKNIKGGGFDPHDLSPHHHPRAMVPEQHQRAAVLAQPCRPQFASWSVRLEQAAQIRPSGHIWRHPCQRRPDVGDAQVIIPGEEEWKSLLNPAPRHVRKFTNTHDAGRSFQVIRNTS